MRAMYCGLWRLLKSDASLSAAGNQSYRGQPQADGTVLTQEMRSFKNADVIVLLRSRTWMATMGRFATGTIRAATSRERSLLYAQIPFEILEKPLAVSEDGNDVLIAILGDKGDPMWMEVLPARGR